MSPPPRCPVAVALVHYPVYDRRGELVTTSITTVDVHDVARTARTFGVSPFYVVTPVEAQRDLARKVADHWVKGWGARSGHPRTEAIALVRVVASLADARVDFEADHGVRPTLVVTGASLDRDLTTFAALRDRIARHEARGVLVVFGTGWGLARDLTDAADLRLEPIRGLSGFNHLPVRAAVAIVLDRLLAGGV